MEFIASVGRLNAKLAAFFREWRRGETRADYLRMSADTAEKYHLWYFNSGIQENVRFLGLRTMKSVADMWNYQEIVQDIGATLVVEFGTLYGGSALYFRTILSGTARDFRVLTVDVDHSRVNADLRKDEHIEFMTCSSSAPQVAARIAELRRTYPGRVFFILDSDHSKHHVLSELLSLRQTTKPGDYVVVEDSNINGHPVSPGWGPGPFEAVEEYFAKFPGDYRRDTKREQKFGFTFATGGFLIRN